MPRGQAGHAASARELEVTMRDGLSSAQIESYREDGFVVIEDCLDDHEARHLRETVGGAVAARGDALTPQDFHAQREQARHRAVSSLQVADRQQLLIAFSKRRPSWLRVLSQHMNLWQTDDALREFCLDPRLGRMACELGGLDGVRLWHDQTMHKPAWGEPTGWHFDTPTFSFSHPWTSTFWFALVDTDLRNGCMHYIRGSHKLQLRTKGNWRLDGLRLLNPEWDAADPVPCPVRAGALIVHNGDAAHGAGANMTPRSRPAYTMTWMPVGSTFNGTPNILPDEILATIAVGDPLEYDDLFPAVYRR